MVKSIFEVFRSCLAYRQGMRDLAAILGIENEKDQN